MKIMLTSNGTQYDPSLLCGEFDSYGELLAHARTMFKWHNEDHVDNWLKELRETGRVQLPGSFTFIVTSKCLSEREVLGLLKEN